MLRERTSEELKGMLATLKHELFDLRIMHTTSQLKTRTRCALPAEHRPGADGDDPSGRRQAWREEKWLTKSATRERCWAS
jgi:hypothetical protein